MEANDRPLVLTREVEGGVRFLVDNDVGAWCELHCDADREDGRDQGLNLGVYICRKVGRLPSGQETRPNPRRGIFGSPGSRTIIMGPLPESRRVSPAESRKLSCVDCVDEHQHDKIMLHLRYHLCTIWGNFHHRLHIPISFVCPSLPRRRSKIQTVTPSLPWTLPLRRRSFDATPPVFPLWDGRPRAYPIGSLDRVDEE